jgi:hypothetical protein
MHMDRQLLTTIRPKAVHSPHTNSSTQAGHKASWPQHHKSRCAPELNGTLTQHSAARYRHSHLTTLTPLCFHTSMRKMCRWWDASGTMSHHTARCHAAVQYHQYTGPSHEAYHNFSTQATTYVHKTQPGSREVRTVLQLHSSVKSQFAV